MQAKEKKRLSGNIAPARDQIENNQKREGC